LTAGPTAEVLLPHSFGLEVDALYRRVGPNHARVNSLEVPFLLKRYLRWSGWHWRPYVSAGYSLRYRSGDTDNGVTAAGGIRVRVGRYRVWPEFRYTHWLGDLPSGIGSNEAGFLTGVTF
jgi:hypothetical protein